MATLKSSAAGVAGVGGTVALRETVDEQTGGLVGSSGSVLNRVSTPSAIYGLGGGSLAGAAWWADENRVLDVPMGDLLGAFALTAIPSGAASAVLPKNGATASTSTASTSTATRQRPVRDPQDFEDSGGGPSEGDETGDYAPAT